RPVPGDLPEPAVGPALRPRAPREPAQRPHRGPLVMPLRPRVVEELTRHGLTPGAEDTAESLRERLDERYLEQVRLLKQRQIAGEIPLRDYAAHVQQLKERFPLLGLPL